MTSRKSVAGLMLLLSLCACKVGPNYQRPPLTVPDQYRGVAPTASQQQPPPAPAESFAQMQWESVFQDDVLRALIKEALTNNYDMRIAATRILQAEANVGITRANQFPTLEGNASIIYERNAFFPKGPTFDTLGLTLNYIVDFWGQYRRATEAARAEFLSTEYARSLVQTTLISSVASDYFLLGQYDLQLKYSQDPVEADKGILNLNTI